MSFKSFMLVFVLFSIIPKTAEGFLLDACASPYQCKCILEYIKCDNLNIPRIPSFSISKQYNMAFLKLQHNNIFVVPPDAFNGIKTKTMYIDLSYNRIQDIHDDAFQGVETAVTILKLNNNELKTLPYSIGNLTNLIDLQIQNNPITYFDDHVMFSIGPHLELLSFGSFAMTEWPKEFQHITNLNTLKVFNLELMDIPEDALDSCADKLKDLLIQNTTLTQVPDAICELRNMETFLFILNRNLTDTDTIMPNCSSPLSHVTSARFDGNDLLDIPDVFHDFPNLTTLYVVDNKNLMVTNGTIPQDTKITNLYLFNNGLNEFPVEINQLRLLHYLDLHGNNITVLQESDVGALNNLLRLNLNDNPIKFIETDALYNLSKLVYISLDNTALTTVPEAVNGTVSLQTISLKYNQINCTCDALNWTKDWLLADTVFINGACGFPSDQQSIEDFISLEISKC